MMPFCSSPSAGCPSFAIARPKGPREPALLAVRLLDKKATHKGLDRFRLAIPEADAHDLVAAWRIAIPQAVHRGKRIAAVVRRKPHCPRRIDAADFCRPQLPLTSCPLDRCAAADAQQKRKPFALAHHSSACLFPRFGFECFQLEIAASGFAFHAASQ
jgi:hypothetical protein